MQLLTLFLFFLWPAVKPDPPVNVTVVVNSSAPSPFLEIRWKSPPNVDVRTGWVTPKYELRVKQNDSKEWKVSVLCERLQTGPLKAERLYIS